MTWVWIRRAVQIACLLFFVFLFVRAAYPVGEPPPDLFLHLDLLASLLGMASGHGLPLQAFWIGVGVFAVTLLLGRVFCGWVCPLGTCIDAGDTLLWRKRKRSLAAANRPWLKFALLAVAVGSALFGIQLGWVLDPIPLLTRVSATAFYPLATMGQSLVAVHSRSAFRSAGLTPWEPWPERHFELSLLAAACFAAIVLAGVLSRRYWCRSLCPLGALLGLIGRFALLKRRVKDSCVGCKLCVRDCKMGAIPAEDPTTTRLPECILCFDCLSCKEKSTSDIGLHWQPKGAVRQVDVTRRQTIQALAGGVVYGLTASTMLNRVEHNQKLIRPPGAIIRKRGKPELMPEDQFRSLCARCGECMKVCVTGGLQPAVHESGWDGVFTPILKPKVGWCERDCTACGEVCPTGALRPFTKDEKTDINIGLATIDSNTCLAWRRGKFYKLCLVCDEQCSYKAVKWHDLDGARRPAVDAELCTGCGICEAKCPVQPEAAITVSRSEAEQ